MDQSFACMIKTQYFGAHDRAYRKISLVPATKQVNVITAEPALRIAVFFQKMYHLAFSLLHALYACTYTHVLVCRVTTTCVLDHSGMDA